jgi:hypothetical protein
MNAFLQLSKIGDVISILPILQQAAGGGKVPLVISKEYAPILEGVSYVEPVIWKGDSSDPAGAVLFAKKRFSRVTVLQTHGNIPVQHTTPSFQLDQWRRGGAIEHFEEWPLEFDQRDYDREAVLAGKHNMNFPDDLRPVILFGDHSQSSPFLQKEELYAMLKAEFGESYRIVRLSEIRAERIYDMLGLFDLAAMLVTVETAHLHLSRASKVPTFVLAANGWRGSAFSSRFKFFMRYGEWENRKHDLISAMRGKTGPSSYSVPTFNLNGYNPSMIDTGERKFWSYRVHAGGTWRTKLYLNDEPLHVPDKYRHYSCEDLRLFMFNGKPHGVYADFSVLGHFDDDRFHGTLTTKLILPFMPT